MRSLTFPFWLLVVAATPVVAGDAPATLQQQVRDTETAFAATMARRDLAAIAFYLADDTVFFGPGHTMRGKAAVIEGWRSLYQQPQAPFSWKSQTVEVLEDGTLAHSSGPVFDPQGTQVGTFNSMWRRQADGTWKIVFDNGCSVCACANKQD